MLQASFVVIIYLGLLREKGIKQMHFDEITRKRMQQSMTSFKVDFQIPTKLHQSA